MLLSRKAVSWGLDIMPSLLACTLPSLNSISVGMALMLYLRASCWFSSTLTLAILILARYVGEKLGVPVVDFELPDGHDFEIDISKARSVLGYRPEYDVFRIVDAAVEFRKSGKARADAKYGG